MGGLDIPDLDSSGQSTNGKNWCMDPDFGYALITLVWIQKWTFGGF